MKNAIYLLTIIIIISIKSFSQTVPNAAFKNWTTDTAYIMFTNIPNPFENLDDWSSTNYFATQVDGIVVGKGQGIEGPGDYAPLLHTENLSFYGKTPGIITLGNIYPDMYYGIYVYGGIPFTQRPRALKFWYISNPSGNDAATIIVKLYKEGNIVGQGFYRKTEINSNWTEDSLVIQYNDTSFVNDFPDTLNITIMSSDTAASNVTVNSSFKIDDLSFAGTVPLLNQSINNISKQEYISIYPDLINGKVTISNLKLNQNYNISVINTIGQIVYQSKFNSNEKEIDLSSIPQGLYIIEVQNNSTRLVKKIIVE